MKIMFLALLAPTAQLLYGMDTLVNQSAKDSSEGATHEIRNRRYDKASFIPHGSEILVLHAYDASGKKVEIGDPAMVDVKIVSSIPKDQT